MKRKMKLSFAELERELSQVKPDEMLSLIGENGPIKGDLTRIIHEIYF